MNTKVILTAGGILVTGLGGGIGAYISNVLNKDTEESLSIELLPLSDVVLTEEIDDQPQNLVRKAWEKDRKNKKTSPEVGKERIFIIRDYTFRLHTTCLSGTAWILDYEIPEEGKSPTKFFFGTNAHVAASLLPKGNEYEQASSNHKCGEWITVVRETDLERGSDRNFQREKWGWWEKGFEDLQDRYDVNKYISDRYHVKDPKIFQYRTNEAKVVYYATDFAGTEKQGVWEENYYSSEHYMSDFAVIEIDFKNEKIANKVTRNFYSKYNPDTGTQKDKALNFFADPLIKDKDSQKLYEENPSFFVAGYPRNGLKGKSTGNYDLTNQQASKLTFGILGALEDEKGDEIIGHRNMRSSLTTKYSFDGKPHHYRGLAYQLEHESLEGGSSGSLVTDEKGNVIGVKSRGGDYAEVDAIRSIKFVNKQGKVIIPEYDLLEGKGPNSRSYRDSIVKYVLPTGKQTYLSKLRNWKAETQPKNE